MNILYFLYGFSLLWDHVQASCFYGFVGIIASYSYKNGDSQAYWLSINNHIPTYYYLHKNGDSQTAYWVFWIVDLHCSICCKSLLTLIVIFFHFDHQTFFWFHHFVFVLCFKCFFSCLFLFFTFSWDINFLIRFKSSIGGPFNETWF